jgi:hypothetical protein
MVQQPGCPNLYWALTNLPSPLVDLHKGIEGDRLLAKTELGVVDGRAPMTDEQLKKAVSRIATILDFQRFESGKPVRSIRPRLQERARDEDRVRAARRRLMEAGCAEEVVRRFPPLQVILLDEKRAYECLRDEEMKMLALPFWQSDTQSQAGESLLEGLQPQIVQARQTQARLEQRIALLRHIEALRMYAASHHGQWPAHLAEMPVPLPVNPFTGKAFDYKVEGLTAHIQGFLPPDETNPASQILYEVTLRR